MTPQHITAVRRSFVRISGRHAQVAAMFRVNLLRFDPTLTALFDDDPDGQHLLQIFAAVVALLSKPELLLPSLRRLGRRLGPDVSAEQVASVGRATMTTLAQVLGRHWDAETEGAWTAAYALVSMTVVRALIDVAVEAEGATGRPEVRCQDAVAIAA